MLPAEFGEAVVVDAEVVGDLVHHRPADLVEPGVVQLHRWRPGPGADTTRPLAAYGAVARKP